MSSRLPTCVAVAISVLLGLVPAARPASAQNASALVAPLVATTSPQPASKNGPEERRIFKDILDDQRDIWTSPLHLHGSDAIWLVPSLLGAAAIVATDKEVNQHVNASGEPVDASNWVSALGSGYTLLGASGAFYLGGRLAHDQRAKATGLLAFEAIVDETIVVTALKAATNRERPNKENGRQDFLDGGNSFPSGHAAASWAFAEVVSEQYRDKPVVRWSAYGVATAVTIARVTAQQHSPSDVYVGALIGYLIGRHVARRGATQAGGTSFTFVPVADPSTRSYGIAGNLQF